MQPQTTSATYVNTRLSSHLSLSEIISALTFALDLVEGAVPGHALRSCLIGMRLAEALQLSSSMRTSLYYALLLKDCGCSSNASHMFQMAGGDDRVLKNAAKLATWKGVLPDARSLQALWQQVAPGKSLPLRSFRMLRLALSQGRNAHTLIKLRCNRGAEIMRRLEMNEESAAAVQSLDEHWDGSGYPTQAKGDAIPLLSRICLLAQTLDMFSTADGHDVALAVATARSGSWFDPELVRAAVSLHHAGGLWDHCRVDDIECTRAAVLDLDPRMSAELSPVRINHICEAFAEVADAKSPFTFRHSLGVADVATAMAIEMGLDSERVDWVRRTALLHDLGKLRVPNSILEKAGKLSDDEWAVVRLHPGLSRSILQRVSSFEELAIVAGEHHEKLDGSGYPLGLRADQLSPESRLLAVADVFGALAEDRPYRPGFEPAKCLEFLGEMAPRQLDGGCYEALRSAVLRWHGKLPRTREMGSIDNGTACCWVPVAASMGQVTSLT